MSKYSSLLRDPRWQRRRLEVLERDGWACRECQGAQSELQVHHIYYRKGLLPWEYDEASLVTLCSDCHAEVESAKRDFEAAISRWCSTWEACPTRLYGLFTGYLHSDSGQTDEERGMDATNAYRLGVAISRHMLKNKAIAKAHSVAADDYKQGDEQ